MDTLRNRPDTSEVDSSQPRLVVVGSSAGGIEALTKLVSTLPVGFPAPIVLAQHLDPTQPSHLGEILARFSLLPVRTVTDHASLEAGTIYVIPADRNVEVTDHELRLQADRSGKRPMPSINLLFSSAARVFGEQLIAVILTGTGSDGASGAYQVKLAGGLVIIENPETAAYPALPASLAPTTVDFVADVERIGPLLSEILIKAEIPLEALSGAPDATVEEPFAPLGHATRQEAEKNNRSLQHLLKLVQDHSNIDFSRYKIPTILRRLHRRMFATNMPDLADYVEYLDTHPDEYPQLVSSFLIKVTEFFRDPELFAMLRERVLPDLVDDARRRGNVLRMWSAGCATGEEAYSLAILVAEFLGAELDQFKVQIFATDVDENAIEFARHGVYPAAALTGLSPQRRTRFFHKLDGNYQIIKSVRGMVVFGLHDLGLGAPFPRMDLLLCRNVLMYFTRALQTRALQSFAFSLRNGGYLALGTAETTTPAAESFSRVSPKLKLYRRVGERALYPMPSLESLRSLAASLPRRRARTPSDASASRRAFAATSGKQQSSEQELALHDARNTRERLGLVVLGLPVGVVVVDRHYDIQIINATAMRLLDIFVDPIGEDLIHLARSIPSVALQRAIDAAFRREMRPIRATEPRQQPPPTTTMEAIDALEGVVTVETLLGERRSLQFTCYPYVNSLTVDATREESPAQQEDGAGATDEASARGGERDTKASGAAEGTVHAHEHAGDVPLVLILVRNVTDEVRRREQTLHDTEHLREVSLAEQAHVRSEMEAIVERLQSENARPVVEMTRQSDINRTLLEGNQKLASANLDLRSANEDLQISEEEAEASAEEVKTLNEELQASNEELMTLNEELEATIEELHASNDELQARTRELQEMAEQLEVKSQDRSE